MISVDAHGPNIYILRVFRSVLESLSQDCICGDDDIILPSLDCNLRSVLEQFAAKCDAVKPRINTSIYFFMQVRQEQPPQVEDFMHLRILFTSGKNETDLGY